MNINIKFTDGDITALKEADVALHKIDCLLIPCDKCPLYLDNRGCLVNILTCIVRNAENEKGV